MPHTARDIAIVKCFYVGWLCIRTGGLHKKATTCIKTAKPLHFNPPELTSSQLLLQIFTPVQKTSPARGGTMIRWEEK